jgi:hypothetical protein
VDFPHQKEYPSYFWSPESISIILAIMEHTGQDFFLPANNSLKSSKPLSTRIKPNPMKKTYVNGLATHVLHEDKKRIRYQIIATERIMLARHPSTAHNGGE